ncbi:beta-N-acetylglucosaminidase domain-containing protein [Allokutzneria sp. A3M-2-11 16]|uniref:beta-N-acetylhexosaminidase family protein n=1 Tax=Allokutzneria sp. A3M-2-11 16 TaxID=2962043 RepID=UPI0020B7B411|nr:beta-N-acetylglucosaminidase domain-containing protein [Allokutzneria sp. A3M-2-11 16]MCP3803976.1 beta-N-acetylglucosaminidase domain-containing protein [Allokutzneria sp. A3M-2-11 16]
MVHAPQGDAATERVVRAALGGDVTVRLGGEKFVGGPESYQVIIGREEVVLDGADPAGTFYAAQTLRRLVERGEAQPGLVVREAPAMPFRGSIEGFYGTPWSHADRLAHLDFLGEHRMNTYVYAPKNDAYHRDRWREPYPADALAELGELITRANDNHVRFVFTVSPGLSMRYSHPDDLAALLAKFEAIRELGGTSFAVALDDIDHKVWHCEEDERRFADSGAAQAWLLNQVQEWAGPDEPVQLVPTEYYDLEDTPYKKALREQLHRDVYVWWTGVGVIPRTITKAEAARAEEVFGHRILLWDNYPVNDYIHGRVPLADYSGRENGLSEHVSGVLSNPMNQAAMSTVALRSFAEFGWDDRHFDSRASWRAALDSLAGGRGDVLDALLAFADLNTLDERLHLEQAPELSARIAEFWTAWRSGEIEEALARLGRMADRLSTAPGLIRTGVTVPGFAAEADAWLEATGLWGRALAAAVTLLAGGEAEARARVVRLVEAAGRPTDTRRPHDRAPVRVGDGVLDRFVAELLAEMPDDISGTDVATLPH